MSAMKGDDRVLARSAPASQSVWIGQASYDSGIELSATNHFPTHHIAPTVELERNEVGSDLARTGLVRTEVLAAFASPVLYARNGGGDFYESDGDALVINFTAAAIALQPQAWGIAGLKTQILLLYDTLLTLPLWVIAGLALITALLVGFALYYLVYGYRVTKRQ
jgi:hypothetical protein